MTDMNMVDDGLVLSLMWEMSISTLQEMLEEDWQEMSDETWIEINDIISFKKEWEQRIKKVRKKLDIQLEF